jgi:hypothetical protein
MSILATIIIALAIYYGLDSVGDGLRDLALGIEEAGIRICDAIETPFQDDEDEIL